MLESFHLQRSQTLVNACWQEKNAVVQKQLGLPASRLMRPEVIGDRARLDLLWNGRELGIYSPSKSFISVDAPDTVTPAIAQMLEEFLASACPLTQASLRFRSGTDDLRGLWIDASNENIKRLLDEGAWLHALLAKGWVVEIGQKHKHVVKDSARDSGLSLDAAPALCWLPSYSSENEEILLKSYISLFSQPGVEVNRALIAAGMELLSDERVDGAVAWAEWGAGYGNLSAAYYTRLGARAWVSELEPAAAELLRANAREFFAEATTERASADGAVTREMRDIDLWLMDPPRSGFGNLLSTLKTDGPKPHLVLAYHCHHEGLSKDTQILRESGYKLRAWSSVDAFPATPHHEVISLWRRSER